MKKKVEKAIEQVLEVVRGFDEEELAGVVANVVCRHDKERPEELATKTEMEEKVMLYILPALLKKYSKL